MTTAIIQGASGGLGLPLTRFLLSHTTLNVIALTSRPDSHSPDLSSRLLYGLPSSSLSPASRLKIISNLDAVHESSLMRGAEMAQESMRETATRSNSDESGKMGKRGGVDGAKDVRLMVCLAGELHPEKSISQISAADALHTFQLNTLSHLLFYKNFTPLIPTLSEYRRLATAAWGEAEGEDPAKGWVRNDGGVALSLSARVGSIGDNEKGGWYSYRASKAALNQVIRCLDHEFMMKKSSSLALAYHPGTTLTSFTRPILGEPKPDESKGIFTPEQAVEKLMNVIQSARRSEDLKEEQWGGRFYDWRGDKLPW